MRGWEHVSLTDIARLGAKPTPAKVALPSKPHKFHAVPCIVTADGTLFTAPDIHTAELATNHPRLGTGTLQERAARCGICGTWFGSTKEGQRYLELHALARTGAISDLRLQVTYDLTVTSKVDGLEHVIGKWIADFVYRRAGEPQFVTEDTKGVRTPLYRRSRRHFEAQYGLRILET
jgi:hypothetical protein